MKIKGFRLFALVVAICAIVVGSFTTADSAHAGTNGQQLSVTTYYTRYLRISGTNQNGQKVQWPSYGPLAPSKIQPDPYRKTSVSGWWWVGTVTIAVSTSPSGPWQYCTVNVPKSQSDDWVYANCLK